VTRFLIVLAVAAAIGTPRAGAVDPDDLAAMLADLEASGGLLTEADLAALGLPNAPSPRGAWELGLVAGDGAPPRTEIRAARRAARWTFQLRARQRADVAEFRGWVRAAVGELAVIAGGGALAHGAGLLAAPAGRRSSLTADAAMLPPSAGWRPSTATAATVRGLAATWSSSSLRFGCSTARDGEGRAAGHLRADVDLGGMRLGAAVLRRGKGGGGGLALDWRRGPWRVAAETARWRGLAAQGEGRAWHVAAGWRGRRWRLEGQAAVSDAPEGLPGSARPACLPGWRGRGWALRLVARPAPRLTVALVHGRGEKRDPDQAAGRRDGRALLGLRVRGRTGAGARWELRLRRLHDEGRRWDPVQPWRPAAVTARRVRSWLTLALTLPARGGEARVTWRWLEEAGESRQLLAAVWSGHPAWGRWRAGLNLAWGAPLDLVAVSAPAPGLVRLRHWGHWQSGLLLGVGGGRRWRWELAGELRRGAPGTDRTRSLEVRAAWGRSF
jgi:hypothetical protein